MVPAPRFWSEIDQLVGAQKYQAAVDLLDKHIAIGAKGGAAAEAEWLRALIKDTELRIALHGYEAAVHFLKNQPWPKSPERHAVVELYYAHALVAYYNAYSWEVNQRERTDSKGAVDLKAWTRPEIFAEINRAYAAVYALREPLGKQPVAAWSGEYLRPNTFPKSIRGTLRDAVSYLWLELLENTSGWLPEQSNEIWQLDFEALLKHPAVDVKLDDSTIHPLRRGAAILAELQAWHEGQGEREAALEAELARLRFLHAHFTSDLQRSAIARTLAERLTRDRDLPWWSAAAAQLADFIQEETTDDNLVRAHAVAQAGAEAHPDSIGGARCRALVTRIDAPSYALTSMQNDAPDRRSLQVTHKNVAALYFRAYKVDLVDQLTRWGRHESSGYWGSPEDFLTDRDQVQHLLKTGAPVAEWRSELPKTLDYKEHRTYVTPPMKDHGAYLIVASVEASFAPGPLPVVATELLLSDLVLTTRIDEVDGSAVVETRSGADGTSSWPAKVTLYRFDWQTPPKAIESHWTALGGSVRFSSKRRDGSYFFVGAKGADCALDPGASFYRPERSSRDQAALVFTDRSVYRPQQKVFWKVLAYQGRSGEATWRLRPGVPVTVQLSDPNYQVVTSATATTDAFGTAAGEFEIPSGRLLGAWRVATAEGGNANIKVEEYKRPTFEVQLDAPEAALRLNHPATLVGEARYYFGLPVTSGAVKWRVSRTPVRPGGWGWWGARGRRPATDATQVVASGHTALGPDGRFRFTFTPAAPEGDASSAVTYRYEASIDLTDEGGETRSVSRAFRLGQAAIEASLSTATGFLAAQKTGELVALRTDLDGAPRAGSGSYRLLALAQPTETLLPADEPLPPAASPGSTFQTPGDRLPARWDGHYTPAATLRGWADGAELAHGELTHDAKGLAHLPWPALPAGAYRVRYQTKDDFGATFETQTELVVADSHVPLQLPALLALEHAVVPVGEKARVLVASGLPGQELLLQTFKDRKLVEQRKLVAGSDGTLVELPIGEKDRGGFSLVLQLLRDHQWITQEVAVTVPWDDKELELQFSTFRDKLKPGTNETWRLTVRDPGGAAVGPGAAQVLAYMYDRSLDFFAAHVPPDPRALWPSFASAEPATASLGERSAARILDGTLSLPGYTWPDGDSLPFYESYGIGGPGGRGHGLLRPSRAMPMGAMAAPMPPEAMADSGEAAKKQAKEPPRLKEQPSAPGALEPGAAEQGPAPLRTDFSETAFFLPNLLTDADGSVAIEFKVPDSVTSWTVWAHALTKDFKFGALKTQTQTVKGLLVRPYLPRFLREGDQAQLKVVINDASDHDLRGTLTLEIFDPDTQTSLLSEFGLTSAQATLPFAVKQGGSTDLTVPLSAPRRVGLVAVKVVGVAGTEIAGAQRPLPLLPSRMHLSQSRFVSLTANETRQMTFEDLAKADDKTRVNEQLAVTVDAQLFLGVLNALPYLVDYPYECVEQTLNRFVTTGILTSLFKGYPGVAAMAKQMSSRDTQLETWSQVDPNRKLALEETPWVQESKGGSTANLAKVLDPRVAAAQRDESLAKLKKAQLNTGAFPWWAGGPPSPYMTLYTIYGLSKALEFGDPVPKEVVQRAFGYLGAVEKEYWAERLSHADNWELLTFLNYVCTNFPDDTWVGEAITKEERQRMLEYSFAHWKQHSPYLKGLLALTLERLGRLADAKLVFDSVMDSAKTVRDEGTFWATEDRSWLWYNDTIETHAFALRTLLELRPGDPRKDGLILWLFLNKKLNHWKSTRATAEVLYALAKALAADHALGVREEAQVRIGDRETELVFEPDQFSPKRQVIIAGPEITAKDSHVEVKKSGEGFAFASATWQYSTDELPKDERGDFFRVSRRYFRRELKGKEVVLVPLTEGVELHVGDELEVQLSLRTTHTAEYVHLRDPRGAGFEPVSQVSAFKWDLGLGFYEEVRDSGENFFFEHLPTGEYTFKYRVRANMAGAFRVGPATVQSLYAPEFNAFSSGHLLEVRAAR